MTEDFEEGRSRAMIVEDMRRAVDGSALMALVVEAEQIDDRTMPSSELYARAQEAALRLPDEKQRYEMAHLFGLKLARADLAVTLDHHDEAMQAIVHSGVEASASIRAAGDEVVSHVGGVVRQGAIELIDTAQSLKQGIREANEVLPPAVQRLEAVVRELREHRT